MILEPEDQVGEPHADERDREDRNEIADPALLVLLVDADDLVREALDGAEHAAQPDALALVHLDHVPADEPRARGDCGIGDDHGDDVEDHQNRSGAISATIR